MDQKDQKPAEAPLEADVDKPLEETDLDVVTGGLTSGVVGGGSDPGCITYSP